MVFLRFWHHDSLFRGALARERSQSSQSDLDIACAEFTEPPRLAELGERAVELVAVRLVLHQRAARER